MKECLRQQRNKHFVKPTITFALRHLYELINFRHSAEVDVSPLTQHWTGSVASVDCDCLIHTTTLTVYFRFCSLNIVSQCPLVDSFTKESDRKRQLLSNCCISQPGFDLSFFFLYFSAALLPVWRRTPECAAPGPVAQHKQKVPTSGC